MNVEFKYLGGFETHLINLAYIATSEQEDTLRLEFRHNANNETSNYNLNNIASFNLSSLKIEGQRSINDELNSTNLNGTENKIHGKFNYK
jgi:hypothetical protein